MEGGGITKMREIYVFVVMRIKYVLFYCQGVREQIMC
jgi:hypothetical protein